MKPLWKPLRRLHVVPDEPAFSAPGTEERPAAPLVVASAALRGLGYDRNTIAVLFLEAAALFARRLGKAEFERLSRRSWDATERQLALLEQEERALS